MPNRFDEFRQAIAEAETTLRAADNVAAKMAALLRGRLHNADAHVLVDLKRELQDFNATTKSWS